MTILAFYTANTPSWVESDRWRRFCQAFSIARKDLAIEFRTKESLNAAGAFAVVILLLFSFAFDPASDETKAIGGGLLWLCFAFAGALIFNRGFARELPNECLDALLASPHSRSESFGRKGNDELCAAADRRIISLIVFGFFYDVRWWLQPRTLLGVYVLGTWGISILGAVFGALTVNLRLRELMLPVLIYPLLIPLLMGAIEIDESLP